MDRRVDRGERLSHQIPPTAPLGFTTGGPRRRSRGVSVGLRVAPSRSGPCRIPSARPRGPDPRPLGQPGIPTVEAAGADAAWPTKGRSGPVGCGGAVGLGRVLAPAPRPGLGQTHHRIRVPALVLGGGVELGQVLGPQARTEAFQPDHRARFGDIGGEEHLFESLPEATGPRTRNLQ